MLWGGAAIGYWLKPLGWIERTAAFVAAALLVVALPLTDEIGIGAGLALLIWHAVRARGKRGADRPLPSQTPGT